MSYQKVTGPLMANSHPGSYCGQDAYNDMFIVESVDELGWNGYGTDSDLKKCRGGQRMPDKDNFNCVIGGDMKTVVRRLTPLECERLQGYPDFYTDIGEWTDSKGKLHKPSDTPRYKALGNSIALPFWQWMAERMVQVLKEEGTEEPTMASLFDGIGGFPLVYSRCGCKPVWASEVEEFCIAVTKKHFPEKETDK